MAPAQGWCVVVESRRAARARSEESDRDPDGSSPAECGETDRRAFVVVARRHTITLKSYTVFFVFQYVLFFHFFRGVAYTRRAVLPRARGLDATRRRATDGGRFGGDGRPASIFFVRRRPPSFVRSPRGTSDRSFASRARARSCATPCARVAGSPTPTRDAASRRRSRGTLEISPDRSRRRARRRARARSRRRSDECANSRR